MCDTLCAVSGWTSGGISYFAKNSDRSPNEPHQILRVPGMRHTPGSMVQCTYISIPQADVTREVILYKPSWIWGAEMGVNDAKVAIGNEAVFTKAKRGKPALLGMDMLRLALERADSAKAAVEIMIDLLEQYGQGGNCGFDHEFFYDNSFLTADPKESYVLETSGKNYAVWRVKDRYAISNRLTIPDFAKRYTEPVYSHFSGAKERRRQVMAKLSSEVDAAALFTVLRSHEPKFTGNEFSRGSVKSVCMHGGGLIGDHTTGSLVAVLRPDKPITLWSTGASTPCMSAFKPVFWGSDAPPVFDDPAQCNAYWLQREHLHRAVVAGMVDVRRLRERIKKLEAEWLAAEQRLMSAESADLADLTALSREAARHEQALIDEFSVRDWQYPRGGNRHARYWSRKNAAL